MIVIVKHARSIGITINGEGAKNRWVAGETEYGFTCRESLDSQDGVAIAGHRITGIEYDIPLDDVNQGSDPTRMTLKTDGGDITLRVTKIEEEDAQYFIIAKN